MRMRKAAYVAVYVLAALAIPLFFGAGRFRPFPETNLYAGELGFSGDRAFADVKSLVEGYPGRSAGTRADRLSALWVQKRLQETGLDARIEEFTCLVREPAVKPDKVSAVPVADLTYTATGYNVSAVSPGRSPLAIVIGAHRDVSGSIQGAEDNASGTASVLELARVLSKGEHYYTYVFMSFDGEEAGLRGSEAFVRNHGDLPVKLAVSLDMTGWSQATTVGFYPFVSAKSASPLWTVALARNLAVSQGLPLSYFGARDEGTLASPVTFWRMRAQRLSSRVPTDTGPFVDRGVPSLGLIAIQADPYGSGRYAPIHGPVDVVEQVSATVMERTGKFAERYVRSLELNSFGGVMDSRHYFVSQDAVLAPQAVVGFAAYWCFLAIGLAVLSWRDLAGPRGAFLGFLRSETRWIALTMALALVSAGFPVLVRSPLKNRLSLVGFNVLWGAVTLGGIAALVCLRGRDVGRRDVSYHEVTARQKLLLNLVYAGVLLGLTAAANPFVALGAALFPLLFLGRISFKHEQSRMLWSLATVVWVLTSLVGMRGRMAEATFSQPAAAAVLADFMKIACWTMTSVYILTVPRRGQHPL